MWGGTVTQAPSLLCALKEPICLSLRTEVEEALREGGWGEQNTVSFLPLACEPTHKRAFFSLKESQPHLALGAGQCKERKGRPWQAGSAGGGGRGGQAGALAYCRSGLDASSHSFPFN